MVVMKVATSRYVLLRSPSAVAADAAAGTHLRRPLLHHTAVHHVRDEVDVRVARPSQRPLRLGRRHLLNQGVDARLALPELKCRGTDGHMRSGGQCKDHCKNVFKLERSSCNTPAGGCVLYRDSMDQVTNSACTMRVSPRLSLAYSAGLPTQSADSNREHRATWGLVASRRSNNDKLGFCGAPAAPFWLPLVTPLAPLGPLNFPPHICSRPRVISSSLT
jgi:hypothetical protein